MSDDRRTAAIITACDGLPTEALERGLVSELYKAVALLALLDKVADRKDGSVIISEGFWEAHVRMTINTLNDMCQPGHTAGKQH